MDENNKIYYGIIKQTKVKIHIHFNLQFSK